MHKNIKCYDNGGKTFDRYTVVYLDQPAGHKGNLFECVGMNETPFHPQGFGQHSIASVGKHLGKEIPFESLPIDCQTLVNRD
jgi:hypothetical protein